jgi:quinolinate synthase
MEHFSTAIETIRKEWGARLLILGHHYQRQTVLRHADVIGDSLELSRKAAEQRCAERIVFCGVRFMAESADILTGPAQTVYMPDMAAGCPMADMADVPRVEAAWRALQEWGGDWLPVVYVNSSAELKALCGRWGGSTCTSSNAPRVIRWAFGEGKRVFFLPDEHLGANTAHDLGLPDDAVAVYDPLAPEGGLTAARAAAARMIVWKGFCIVHKAFTGDQVRMVREKIPGARIIVHPETPKDVLRLADAHGSTAQIVQYVEAAPAGSTVVIGTEANLVERLAIQHAGRITVKLLRPSVCANMAKTNERNLLEVLEHWPKQNEVHVPDGVAADARRALQRMLEL